MVWTKARIGFEATAAFAPSLIAVTDTTGTSDHSASVILASARVVLPVSTRRSLWSFYLAGGIGLVRRGGAVFQYSTGLTARTWVVAFGGQTPLTHVTNLRFELEDNISTAQFDQGLSTATLPQVHNDFVIAVGVQFPVGHRAQ